MGKRLTIFILLLSSFSAFASEGKNILPVVSQDTMLLPPAQATSPAELAKFLNSTYQNPTQKLRALYRWLAYNITYDVKGLASVPLYYEKQDLISKTFTTRTALCQGYAEVFQEVCFQLKIPSYVVPGFVVPRRTSTPESHAWVAARVEGKWFLFDPTWGAGTVEKGIFQPYLNERYFMVPPSTMVKTHIPFDPLWQFLQQPLTYQEFSTLKSPVSRATSVFSFNDTLSTYEDASKKDRLVGTIRRMESNKGLNPVVLDHLHYLKKELQVIRQNEVIDVYNSAVSQFNEGVALMNSFIRYRNNQFQPVKPDQEVKRLAKGPVERLLVAKRQLQIIKAKDNPTLLLSVENLHKVVDKALAKATENELFLEKYYKTPAPQRKTLFYKSALADHP